METILSIAALVISLISCGFALYTFIWTAQRDRRQATLDAYNALQEQVFDRLNLYRPAEIAEFSEHPMSKEYNEISALVARIEHFCVGVREEIYDRKTVYELAHGYFDGNKLIKRIEPIIDKKNSRSEHDYYASIHWMLEWMQAEADKHKGKSV